MAVNISGTVLASLFYDNSSSNGDQTGFLIGEVVHHVKDTISDSQINNVEVKTKTYVFDCIPWPRDKLFHNTSGDILRQRIMDLLPNKEQNIVGWYSFRRNSTIRPSFRERLLHCNLTHALGQEPNMFLFLLCSSRASTNRSTHTFDHSFLHLDNNIFKRVPVDIINLGDTTHAEYKCAPSQTVASKHGAFSRIVKTHEGEFLNSHGHMEVKQIQMLNGAIRRQLDNISQSVINSETRCSDLEQEVAQYRKRAKLKLLEQQQALQQQHAPQVPKGPSVDDILSMDKVDDLPSEILLGQGHNERTKGQSVGIKVNSETDSKEQNMDTSVDSSDGSIDIKESQSFKVKLTTPAVLHTRSSSSPVDTASGSSQLNVSRTRSKSGDDSFDKKGEQKVTTDSKNTKGESGPKSAKNSDPFDFVGSMIAESKKDVPKLANTRKSKNYDTDTDVAMETEEYLPTTHGKQTRHNTGAAVSAAQTLSQTSRTTRSQRSKGQEHDTVTPNSDHNSDSYSGESSEKDEHTSGKTRKARENTGNMKTCGQEVSQKQHIEIETDESSCSQDTYERDMSSSPVY